MECRRIKRIFRTCLMKQPPSRLVGTWHTMFLIVVSFFFTFLCLFSISSDTVLPVCPIQWVVPFRYFNNLKAWFSENMSKEPEECRETSSQVKRRRMLQFNSQAMDPSHEQKSSAFIKSNVSAGVTLDLSVSHGSKTIFKICFECVMWKKMIFPVLGQKSDAQ